MSTRHREPDATSREQPLIRTFVELADTLTDDFDLPGFLHRLLNHCTDLVETSDSGVLLTNARGGIDLLAFSSERSADVEVFQLNAHSGPCLEALASGAPVQAGDLAADRGRWPGWSEVALAAEIRSVYAIPMRLREQTIGALNLFSSEPNAVSRETLSIIQAFTDLATIGILQERAIRRNGTLAEQLRDALDSRVIIEQAKGILAGQSESKLHMNEAFRRLSDYSRRNNIKLAVVSQSIVDGTLNPARLIGTPRRKP